jgi:poly(3-hydroxybutyrate) depolymerase
MYKRATFYLAVLIGLTANAQTINLAGVVSNTTGQPIANAIVTLVGQGMKDTTGTDGKYSLAKTVAVQLPLLMPQSEEISMNNGVLQFSLSNSSPVKVEIFDVKGNLLKKESFPNASKGFYRVNIEETSHAAKLLFVRTAIGQNEATFRCIPLHNGKYAVNQSSESPSPVVGALAKVAAISDTLKTSATGFVTKSTPITSYDNQQQNITLDSSKGDYHYMGNPPGPSIGCGKTLGAINKSGTYTVTSSGTNRTFIINIPTNYDKNKPYRLIFGMHCMGGSAIKVAGTDNGQDQSAFYYHVKTQADKDSIQAIYVAPQGDAGGTWQGEPDRKFFSDMVNLFKDTLCIDTTRIFSVGFSFGAMFTYTLSLEFPKVLRAVTCIAPANYSMDQPTNNHVPIGYFQTTGTTDGTCPWISSDANKTGGKYCLLQHIQDNGCTVPTTFNLATSSTHVSTNFTCPAGYPVKFSSFQGGHQCNSTDGGTNFDWIPVETWAFFKQF